MARVKRGTKAKARRKKILKAAKGYRGGQSKLFRTAVEKVAKGRAYAYRDRKAKKRDFRALWITRIGIASKINGISYSRFMAGLKKANIGLDRKVLSEIAVNSPVVFKELIEKAKAVL
ncbi:50S ribosomal protein L20 [bacterium]|nr:50S ribosomal protein L20 [bacterium]